MNRLDKEITQRGLVISRSQAENYIKLGVVLVNGKTITKPGWLVGDNDNVVVEGEQYVSRAALKLASVSHQFGLEFKSKTVLDVGSSTGGFTDYALQHGAKRVIAVDVGTEQLHPSLRVNKKVELYEKTDIRDFKTKAKIDYVVADVSFISLTKILPSVLRITNKSTQLIIMCKPQFEAQKHQINKGIIKNSSMRRAILKDFEAWLVSNKFIIKDKADSQVAGTKGNVERFYKLITT
ncbi:MAG: 23S rRNA (cytidine1920-2'-O)/16S rRNA (cytidine1409-2'-O)-methyltransferase [Candidatus Saccharimonadales bacterium]